MTRLHFDDPQGIIFIDGIRYNDISAIANDTFCIEYVPYDDAYMPILCAFNGKNLIRDDIIFIRHGKDYIIRFCPQRRACKTQDEIYIQKVLEPKGGKSHCLTCHKDDSFNLSVETDSEITTLCTPCKVIDVKFSCIQISSGQLLLIFAKLENNKTYVCVLHYNDDYALLLDICCDEVCIEEDGLLIYDCLRDTLDRKCVRKLSYSGDCFVEQSRHFEGSCSHRYIDEAIPYILVESVCYGDDDSALNCLAQHMHNCDLRNTFGNFVGICDCLDYKPFEIVLLYSGSDGLYTQKFKFDVSNGKIHKIKLTQI